jgi:autotransporter-associated beta strand protein
MKRSLKSPISCVALLAALASTSPATVFFSDSFTNGSSINSVTPALPTTNATAYQLSSSKVWLPTPSITPNQLTFGIGSTTGGGVELQALFTTNPVALVAVGDFVRLTVTFTNVAGLLTVNGPLGFGLYNGSQVAPIAGGLNGTALNSASDKASGGVKDWQGYWGQRLYTGEGSSRIVRRLAQTGADNRNQNLTSTGSSSQSYGNPAGSTVGVTSSSASGALMTNNVYTVVLRIDLIAANTLAITNTYHDGPSTNSPVLASFGTEATGADVFTTSFDGLAIGWRMRANTTGGSVMTVTSITVDGSVTLVTAPPDILTQPASVTVPAGGATAFSVVAQGFGMSYQWKRYGTNLVNGGNIFGATTDTLFISPVSAADVAAGANGYSVTISGAGGYTTNSQTASLSLGTAKNLVWAGVGNSWDLGTSANWLNGGSPATFNYGDAVTFNDSGVGELSVVLSGAYLTASSVIVDTTTGYDYLFSGSGSIAGPGSLLYQGSGILTINNVNTHTGGTIISNASAYLVLNNYSGLGSGPVTLAKAGGFMEIVPAGAATVGVKGDVNVQDDFTIQYDGNGSFATVFLGNLGGAPGKTLTLNPLSLTTTNRIRVYGTATTCDANLVINGPSTTEAAYYGTTFAPYHGSGSQIYNGVISGAGGVIQRAGGLTVLAGQNTYTGGTTPTTGTIGFGANTVGAVTSGPIGTGPLYLNPEAPNTTGSGSVLAFGGARTIANPIQYSSATNNLTLIVAGTNDLTFTGAYSLNGNDGLGTITNRTIEVNNTGLTTLGGAVSGTGFGLTKTGTGVLAMSANNSYTGPTAISAGTLRVNGSLAAASAVTVATNATLAGTGTINGATTVAAGGVVAPGNASIGTLTINNNLTLAGKLAIEINRSGLASDKAVVSGTLTNAGVGTVAVTNLGAALQAGDTFALFNKAVANGAALSVSGGGAVWTNKLAVDGTIAVITPISSTPTNITYTLSGNTLTLQWPLDHLTWTLQSNSVSVASSGSWFPIPGTQNSNQYVITVDPAKSNVFYRLVAP